MIMGEYAKRKSDGEQIKIGTCESMYYLRYEDRDRVIKEQGSVDPATVQGCFWRLPFPDEDNIEIGNYSEFNRGLRLYRKREDESGYCDDFVDSETVEHPGTIQLKHESGLLVNVKCYHGEKLPDSTGDVKMFWNGKSWSYELTSVKNTENGLEPVVSCRHCGQMWRYNWSDILPFVGNVKMRERLEAYAGIDQTVKLAA